MSLSQPSEQAVAKTAPRRGLGRGLSALIPATPEVSMPSASGPAQPASGLQVLPLAKISLNPYQPRAHFEPQQMQELVDSIKQHGILQPIVVRPKGKNGYELVAGERRFRAATSAGLSEIPAVIKSLSDQESLALALIENIQREELNSVETARAYRRLIEEFQLTQMRLAQEVGKSQSSIANALRLLSLPTAILTSLEEGAITEGHAKAILTVELEEGRLALWQEIVRRKLSVREAERRAAAAKSRRTIPRGIKESDAKSPDSETRALARELSLVFGTSVRLRFSAGERGCVEIEFYDAEHREAVIERLLSFRRSGE